MIRWLQHTLKSHKPQIVFFMETKLCRQQMEQVRRSCGFQNGIEVDADGTREGLCLVWKRDVNITLRTFSKLHIDVLVEDSDTRVKWR